MSLKLPRKQFNKPLAPVQGRLRRYSDRMISSCKDLAAECAVSCLDSIIRFPRKEKFPWFDLVPSSALYFGHRELF